MEEYRVVKYETVETTRGNKDRRDVSCWSSPVNLQTALWMCNHERHFNSSSRNNTAIIKVPSSLDAGTRKKLFEEATLQQRFPCPFWLGCEPDERVRHVFHVWVGGSNSRNADFRGISTLFRFNFSQKIEHFKMEAQEKIEGDIWDIQKVEVPEFILKYALSKTEGLQNGLEKERTINNRS